jgi:large subunit ribosomal protein L10
MKRTGILIREKIVEEVQRKAHNMEACYFVSFNKLNALAFSMLRNSLKKTKANIFVTKNSLFKRAFENLGYKDLKELLEAETGVVFVYDEDIVKACKIIFEFSRDNENFKLKGGFLGKEKISVADLNALARLPSREVLLGMAVGSMAAPLKSFVIVLNQIILRFVWAIQEIKNKKES